MDFNKYKTNTDETIAWLKKEFTSIRTGAASISILDNIKVEAYDSFMPINQLASIGIEDAKTLSINPFDTTVLKDIEKAINNSDIGLSVSVSGTTIRLSFPNLTADRRVMLLKLAKEKLEEARITLRKQRDKMKNDIDNSDLGDDEKFGAKEKMEEMTKKVNEELDALYKKKEEEISE